MDFGFATISLVVQTAFALTENRQPVNNGNQSLVNSLESSLPMRPSSLSNPISVDIGILCSTCIASGLLTFIYQRGRGEKLHAPLFIATIIGSFIAQQTMRFRLDILILTVFEWILALALLVSRYCEHFLPGDIEAHDAASCWGRKETMGWEIGQTTRMKVLEDGYMLV